MHTSCIGCTPPRTLGSVFSSGRFCAWTLPRGACDPRVCMRKKDPQRRRLDSPWFLFVAAAGCSAAQPGPVSPPRPHEPSLSLEPTSSSGDAPVAASGTSALDSPANSKGKLPRTVIRQVLRDGFGEVEKCYMEGLKRNKKLQGSVLARIVIDEKGRVESAAEEKGAPSFPDSKAAQCILAAYKRLTFPSPEGGKVTFVYPITLAWKAD